MKYKNYRLKVKVSGTQTSIYYRWFLSPFWRKTMTIYAVVNKQTAIDRVMEFFDCTIESAKWKNKVPKKIKQILCKHEWDKGRNWDRCSKCGKLRHQ